MSATYTVLIPYFSEEEIDRYLIIADRIRQLGPQQNSYEFVLASSPKIAPSQRLLDGFQRVAPTRHYACPTQVFGYPQGPTAMFWDCMDFLAAQRSRDLASREAAPRGGASRVGFGLWMESDMVPVKTDWLDRLVAGWQAAREDCLMMGCYVPNVVKRRFIRRKRVWIHEHLNGGACYSNDFASAIPGSFRQGTFDTAIWPYLKRSARYAVTPALSFSTVANCRTDMADPEKTILHGFMQDKDAFVNKCVRPLEPQETRFEKPTDAAIQRSHWIKRQKLRFIKRGRPAMMEALLMEQETAWRNGTLDSIAVGSGTQTGSSRAA